MWNVICMVSMYVCMYVYMYVCMYVCMYACMYVYMYVCMYVFTGCNFYIFLQPSVCPTDVRMEGTVYALAIVPAPQGGGEQDAKRVK